MRERERERVDKPSRNFNFSLKAVAVLLCFGFLFFGLAGRVNAATYTVCSSSCDSTTIQGIFNGNDLGPDDIVEVRADTQGGAKTYREAVSWGSNDGGSSGHPLILRGRTGDTITLHGDSDENGVDDIGTLIDIDSVNYVEVQNLILTHPTTDGLQIRGTSTGVVVRNVESTYSGNQAFQMEGIASATYYNIVGNNNVDDGFSMHDSTTAEIHTGTFNSNLSGINKIYSSSIIMDDVTASNNTQDGFYTLYDTGGVGGTNIISNSTFSNNPSNIRVDNDQSIVVTNVTISGGAYGLRLDSTGILNFSDIEISGASNLAVYLRGTTVANIFRASIHNNNTEHVVDVETGSGVNLNHSIIYNNIRAGKYAFVARAGSVNTIRNSVFYNNTNGLAAFGTGRINLYNSIVSNVGNGILFSTGAVAGNVILSNNDFYNNAANFSGASPTNTNGILTNPLFVNAGTDFSLQSTSSAINAGTDVGLSTDYAGNPIYGTPDIGAYEYQPSHDLTLATPDTIDIGAGARIYADGKFIDLGTTNSIPAKLKVSPAGGSYTVYDATSTRPAYLDVTSITNWTATHKTWTESNSIAGLTNTLHTIGDLIANKYYAVKLDDVVGQNITGDNCTNGICLSSSSGEIVFTYTGTYSTHTFDIEQFNDAALSGLTISQGTLSPTFASSTLSYTASVANDVANLTVTPTANQASSTITVNGTLVTSGSASSPITLNVGANTILTVTLAQDASTTKTYTIVVTREAPALAPQTVTAPTTPTSHSSSGGSTQSQVNNLIAMGNYTLAGEIAKQYGITIPSNTLPQTTTKPNPTNSILSSSSFTRDLKLGMKGLDVKLLQQFLNTHGFPVSKKGVGSKGRENTTFGPATKAALVRFQKANKIVPAVGYFGPKTQAAISKEL